MVKMLNIEVCECHNMQMSMQRMFTMAVSINGIAFAVNIRLWGPQRSSEKRKERNEERKQAENLGYWALFMTLYLHVWGKNERKGLAAGYLQRCYWYEVRVCVCVCDCCWALIEEIQPGILRRKRNAYMNDLRVGGWKLI